MEVTRKNFKETLPLISESIKKADFLTIDTEFTGLMNGRDVSIFDSPAEYYNRLYNGASEFLLIQYGLCAFYWNDKKEQYMNEAYNFYLFPRRPGPEKMFLCQSSSLDFLAAQGFDFNKLIKEGISYMTESTESRLRDMLTERQKSYSAEKDLISIPEQHKQQIADICKKVRKFLDDKELEEMEIDRCNNFVRRLLFQELAQFKDEAFVETKVLENQNRVLKVTRLKEGDDVKSKDNQKKEKEWEEFEDAVGFSKVARMISQSGKLVIGHNMLLDVLHTLNHFFQPLPDDYSSFKEFTHCMFPSLLDTKYMSSLPPFKDKINSSVLQHLFTTLSEEPFSLPHAESESGRGYSRTDDKQHEAGYDAYVTGLCFLAMYSHLSRMRGETAARVAAAACPVLKPFLNKLFLAKTAHQDSPYMNLTGADLPLNSHLSRMRGETAARVAAAACPVLKPFLNKLFLAKTAHQDSPYMNLTGADRKYLCCDMLVPLNSHLSRMRGETAARVAAAACPVLKPFLNKLFLAKTAHQDSPYMNLTGDDPTPTRDHVFHLTFPMEWQRNEINQLFSPFGPVTVQFLDDVSAIVALSRREQARDVTRALGKNAKVTLIPYTKYKQKVCGKQVQTELRRQMSPVKQASSPRQVNSTAVSSSPLPSPVARSRSNSVNTPPAPATSHPTRKRTSSGVFQVDDAEPPPKKAEVTRSSSETRKKVEVISNGLKSGADGDKDRRNGKERGKEMSKAVMETFDGEAKGKTVTAFKESDSWD